MSENPTSAGEALGLKGNVAIASDHAGYELKEILRTELGQWGYGVIDLGTKGAESVDYPDYGHAMAKALADEKANLGVIVCGTGIGISIAANRHEHVRAAVCTNGTMARFARLHNDANVLALGSRIVGVEVAKDCLAQFLETPFEGGRHARRIAKLSKE